MNKFEIIITVISIISLILGLLIKHYMNETLGLLVSLPVLCISGFAAFGHLITLDDDMPGEWSNPEGNKELWHSSLKWLGLKILIFSVCCALIFY